MFSLNEGAREVRFAAKSIRPVTVLWRALREAHAAHAKVEADVRGDAAKHDAEIAELGALLAECLWRLDEMIVCAAAKQTGEEPGPLVEELRHLTEEMRDNLLRFDIEYDDPTGRPFSLELADQVQVIAPVYDQGVNEAFVHTTIRPIIRHGGDLVRMGKVVVARPRCESQPADRDVTATPAATAPPSEATVGAEATANGLVQEGSPSAPEECAPHQQATDADRAANSSSAYQVQPPNNDHENQQ